LLNEKVEIIYEGTEEDQDKKEEEEENNDCEIEEIEQDSVDQNDLKSKLQQFERRVTRNFSKRNENEEDNDDNDVAEVIAHKNNNEELNESLQKWLSYFTNINSIDDLALVL
jgi:hypothetical protein